MPPPPSSSSTVQSRKSAFVRRQVRHLSQPLRPSIAWTERNATAEPIVVTVRRRRRVSDQSRNDVDNNNDDDDELAGTAATAADDNHSEAGNGDDDDGPDDQTRTRPGGLAADVVARVLRQVNLRLKKHATHSYPSVAIRHVGEQIDKLYWHASAPVDEDAQLKAIDFAERIRRDERLFRSGTGTGTGSGIGSDNGPHPVIDLIEAAWEAEAQEWDDSDGGGDNDGHGDDDDENDYRYSYGNANRRSGFAPSDPRSRGLVGTRILPRVGDDLTRPAAFKTLPSEWDPSLDHTGLTSTDNSNSTTMMMTPAGRQSQREHHQALAREYVALYHKLRNLHDQRDQLVLRSKAYTELGHLVDPLVGSVEITNQNWGEQAGPTATSMPQQNVQPNLVARDSDLVEQMRVARAKSLQLRVKLANQQP